LPDDGALYIDSWVVFFGRVSSRYKTKAVTGFSHPQARSSHKLEFRATITITRITTTTMIMRLFLVLHLAVLAHAEGGNIKGSKNIDQHERDLTYFKGGFSKISKKANNNNNSENDSDNSIIANVFTSSNAFDEIRSNEVIMYNHNKDGTLSVQGRFPTGGLGSGPGYSIPIARADALATQNPMVSKGEYLLVVNAGPDDVSVFLIEESVGLTLTDRVYSGGVFPTALALHDDIVYVLNAAGTSSLSGFRLTEEGKLIPIKDSTVMLDAQDTGFPPAGPFSLYTPGQIGFTDDGKQFIVVYKDTPEIEGLLPGRIAIYDVDHNGWLGAAPTITTIGAGQFAYVTVAENGVNFLLALDPSVNSVSSYIIKPDGSLMPITQFVVNGEGGFPCWIVKAGSYVYTANFLGHSVSSYQVGDDFSVTALEAVAASTGERESFPLDMAVEGGYLYQLYPGTGTIGVYTLEDDGSLTLVGEFDGLEPTSAEEDAATVAFTTVGGSVAGMVVVPV
jgi:6-phosphogluconolactonase